MLARIEDVTIGQNAICHFVPTVFGGFQEDNQPKND